MYNNSSFFSKRKCDSELYIYQGTEYIKVVKYVHVPVTLSLYRQNPPINREKTD